MKRNKSNEKQEVIQNPTRTRTSSERIKRMTVIGLFTALAYLCVVVFRIQVAGFLTFDMKDAVMTVGALCLGPAAGVMMAFLVALIEMVTISTTQYYGFLMNFLASSAFVLTATLIYRKGRNLLSAIIGLISAIFVMSTVMFLANYLVTPYYICVVNNWMERERVLFLIPTTILPFNVLKALTNAALTMILYKPLTSALARSKMIYKAETSLKFTKSNLLISLISLLLVIGCLSVYFLFYNGKFIF